ncbi:MAG: hypothetical protein MAG453_00140 [Calditrichaeota bacterium]|nr:hypothetical protein [Calditrichota bacterium]
MRPRFIVHTAARTATILLLAVTLTGSASAQHAADVEGLLQGEHIARTTTLYDGVLKAAADTTAWLAFGTHSAALAAERAYAPTRFTAFVVLDTSGVAHAADPSLTLRAQVALTDTAVAYVNRDGTLELAPPGNPITALDGGRVFPVPIYGGGWLRFILAVDDSARVMLDLWRAH